MKYIQNERICVCLLAGKHHCVNTYLNAIDLDFKIVDNKIFQEIQMNMSCRYHDGKESYGDKYPMHPLDDVQERI